MLTQFNEKLKEGSALPLDGRTSGISVKEPGLWPKGTTVADADRALVVFVAVVDGAGDEVYRDADVGGLNDKSLFVNDEVVSEERHSMVIRLALTI